MAVTRYRENEQKRILLAGRAWLVEAIDWDKHEILVSEQPTKAKVRWPSEPIAESFRLVRAKRAVLLGETPDVTLSLRATERLARLREELESTVSAAGTVIQQHANGSVWWTWAGWRANETVIAALGVDATSDNEHIQLPPGVGTREMRAAVVGDAVPWVTQQAVDGLKFSAALPVELARRTLAERNADRDGAAVVLSEPLEVRLRQEGERSADG
jgi:ATP-dependent Lhr-like helicase